MNGVDLASSTAVFLDPLMTVCAPDGFYSDGLLVREQVGCVLLESSVCDGCGLDCQNALEIAAGEGIYILNVDLGTATGAVLVTFTPNDSPDGIKVNYDGLVYNALSSPLDGYHAAPTNLPTYVGNNAFDCGLVAGSPYIVTEYENNGLSFTATGNTPTVTISGPQVSTSLSNPAGCVMVIPKPSAAPSGMSVVMYGICSGSTYNVTVLCPERLPAYYSTEGSDYGESCGLDTDQIYYSARVNGDGITLGLYDWVFSDYNGQNVLPDGYYAAPIHLPSGRDTYRVQNGIITEFLTLCSAITLNYDVQDTTSGCVTGGILTANLLVEWMPLNTMVIDYNANTTGSTSIQTGLYKITFTVTYDPLTTGCGYTSIMRLKLNGTTVVLTPDLNPSAGAVYQVTHTFSANDTASYLIEALVYDGTPI